MYFRGYNLSGSVWTLFVSELIRFRVNRRYRTNFVRSRIRPVSCERSLKLPNKNKLPKKIIDMHRLYREIFPAQREIFPPLGRRHLLLLVTPQILKRTLNFNGVSVCVAACVCQGLQKYTHGKNCGEYRAMYKSRYFTIKHIIISFYLPIPIFFFNVGRHCHVGISGSSAKRRESCKPTRNQTNDDAKLKRSEIFVKVLDNVQSGETSS